MSRESAKAGLNRAVQVGDTTVEMAGFDRVSDKKVGELVKLVLARVKDESDEDEDDDEE